jgi:hypothetical protein
MRVFFERLGLILNHRLAPLSQRKDGDIDTTVCKGLHLSEDERFVVAGKKGHHVADPMVS